MVFNEGQKSVLLTPRLADSWWYVSTKVICQDLRNFGRFSGGCLQIPDCGPSSPIIGDWGPRWPWSRRGHQNYTIWTATAFTNNHKSIPIRANRSNIYERLPPEKGEFLRVFLGPEEGGGILDEKVPRSSLILDSCLCKAWTFFGSCHREDQIRNADLLERSC